MNGVRWPTSNLATRGSIPRKRPCRKTRVLLGTRRLLPLLSCRTTGGVEVESEASNAPEPSGGRADLVCGPRPRQGRALQLLPCGCERRPPAASVSVQRSPHQDAPPRRARSTWEDEKERQMFCVLLIPPECVSVCLAPRLAVWCRVDDPLSSHRLPSLPKRSGYGRNAASPPACVISWRRHLVQLWRSRRG